MKKLVMSVFVFLFFLTGCSNDEAYNNAVQKGNDCILSEDYQKAESAFELALDEKMNDEKATALLTQTVSYQKLIKEFNEGNFALAIESANEVIQIENGSSVLVEKSEEVLEVMEALERTLTVETEKYERALNHFEADEYDQASAQLENILNENPEHPIFDSLNENIDTLTEDIEAAQLVEKKEKAEKEKKEKEAKEKEKQEKEAESSSTYEAEAKVGNKEKEKSRATYEAEMKEKNENKKKSREEYEAEMKTRNEEREKSREAYDAEMKQRNADRDKRNRERNY